MKKIKKKLYQGPALALKQKHKKERLIKRPANNSQVNYKKILK